MRLARIFSALVDPTRRAILMRLERDGTVAVGELAKPFTIQLPAVMKHLAEIDLTAIAADGEFWDDAHPRPEFAAKWTRPLLLFIRDLPEQNPHDDPARFRGKRGH